MSPLLSQHHYERAAHYKSGTLIVYTIF